MTYLAAFFLAFMFFITYFKNVYLLHYNIKHPLPRYNFSLFSSSNSTISFISSLLSNVSTPAIK